MSFPQTCHVPFQHPSGHIGSLLCRAAVSDTLLLSIALLSCASDPCSNEIQHLQFLYQLNNRNQQAGIPWCLRQVPSSELRFLVYSRLSPCVDLSCKHSILWSGFRFCLWSGFRFCPLPSAPGRQRMLKICMLADYMRRNQLKWEQK